MDFEKLGKVMMENEIKKAKDAAELTALRLAVKDLVVLIDSLTIREVMDGDNIDKALTRHKAVIEECEYSLHK